MLGSNYDFGIVQRSIEFVFKKISDANQVKAIFFEIYNETLVDLLITSTKPNTNQTESKPITISAINENGKITDKIVKATEINIQSSEHFNEVLQKVNERRSVSSTERNAQSSRSHAVIQIESSTKFGNKLTFSDLNLILVIESLKKNETIPDFQSSKLTRILKPFLKPFLTGKAKTVIITTISQDAQYFSTSKQSLELTQSAGEIRI